MEISFNFQVVLSKIFREIEGFIEGKAAVSVFRAQFRSICHTVEDSILGYEALSV